MPILTHKFSDYQVHKDTEILLLGTFVHDIEESGDFFYGRTRSFLWHLLPICYGLQSLKEAALSSKQAFMKTYKIDFVDVIQSIEVPDGEENNHDDTFVDESVHQWKDIKAVIDQLPNLKAVYFTRKTFNTIPNCRKQLVEIAAYCQQKNIRICKLETPAKYFDQAKQQQWKDAIVLQKTCMKV